MATIHFKCLVWLFVIFWQESNCERGGNAFSLFNVVNFKNDACSTISTITRYVVGTRNGTCYTDNECIEKGGIASGGCAQGFGVCCLFSSSKSGDTIRENCSYVQNPNFPSVYTTSQAVTYTVEKCTKGVCFLRLDFEAFSILGPGSTLEVDGGVCTDKLETTTGFQVPLICGQNAGHHIYVDIGAESGDSVKLAFTFEGESSLRSWEIKVGQIPCASPTNQGYSICIRQEAGFCCVQYSTCIETGSFTLSTNPVDMALQDEACTLDYIGLNHLPICDCTEPFIVDIRTDVVADYEVAEEMLVQSRGVCLQFIQLPC
eukprot:13825.XXX_144505_146013_1 [CDS] Oithona nana genome sequencing.